MIAAIQKMKSTFAAGLFAALVISATPVIASAKESAVVPAAHVTFSDLVTPSWSNAALLAFFLAQVRLWTREGDTAPVRYNLDELAVGENVTNNLFYLVDDGVIGHFGKKPYLTVDTDNSRIEVALGDAEGANGKPLKDALGNKIKVSTACYPKGLMGWGAYYITPILGALGVTVTIKLLFDSYNEANRDGKSFVEVLAGKLKYAKDFVLLKRTDIGFAPAVNLGGALLGKK